MTTPLAKLTAGAERRAMLAVERQIGRLAQLPRSSGVGVEATDDGAVLSGKSLRRRMLTDFNLRNFGR